jgi:branched-chain amino acid transport system ATP-binding protein
MPELLAIHSLRAGYGPIQALRGIDLSVNEGEIVTLIGANGAGKTTLLMTICGIVRASGGRVTFSGHNIASQQPYEIMRQGIAQVPEGRRIFPKMTVRENLLVGAQHLNGDGIDAGMERAFAMFPILAERRHQSGGTLSGGEQQMLAIARALMSRPRLLLMDEPSLGLAPLMAKQIFQIIREINAAGTTVLLVEQNAYVALQLAQRGYVLATGAIVLSGPSRELLDNPEIQKAYLGG